MKLGPLLLPPNLGRKPVRCSERTPPLLSVPTPDAPTSQRGGEESRRPPQPAASARRPTLPSTGVQPPPPGRRLPLRCATWPPNPAIHTLYQCVVRPCPDPGRRTAVARRPEVRHQPAPSHRLLLSPLLSSSVPLDVVG
jgi:hypothetical protein